MSEQRERILWLDLASGVLICFMVFGHVYNTAFGDLLEVFPFMSFFMPWFFFKSGVFFKPTDRRSLFSHDFNKYIKPYIIWSAIGLIVYYLALCIDGQFTPRDVFYIPVRRFVFSGTIPMNAPLWFLLSLFIVRAVFDSSNRKNIHPIIVSICGIALGLVCFLINCRFIPWWVQNGASGIVFFSMGVWLSRIEKSEENNRWPVLEFLSVLAFIIFCIIGYPSVVMAYNTVSEFITDYRTVYYFLWFPASVAAIVVFNFLCRNVSKIYSFPLLRAIGRNAITIYVSHQIVIFIMSRILLRINPQLTGAEKMYFEIAALAFSLPLVIVLKKYIISTPAFKKFFQEAR